MLEIEDRGSVRTIRLNRPPVNALNGELIAALAGAVEAAPSDGARALILAGRPGMFSAGLDVPALLQLERPELHQVWRDFYRLMKNLVTCPIPIAAAMTGHSPAGGAVLGIFCDYRVMAEGSYKVGLNEVRVGIALPSVIYQGFEALVGPRQAALCAMRGDLLDAESARKVGLVDETCPLDEVEARAAAWLGELLRLPPAALAATRSLARRGLRGRLGRRERRRCRGGYGTLVQRGDPGRPRSPGGEPCKEITLTETRSRPFRHPSHRPPAEGPFWGTLCAVCNGDAPRFNR